MRLVCRHSSPPSKPALLDCSPLYSVQSVRCTDRASGEIHMHALTHVRTASHTRTTHLPPAHTFLILLPLLMADAFCSLLFPFSLSLSAPPFPFSISSFFLSATHAVGLSSQPPPSPFSLSLSLSLSRSLSLSPSLHSPPSHAASPSISSPLSLQCVLRERPLSEPERARTMEWRSVQ